MPRTGKQLTPHQFKKGKSGNPLGGKLHDPEIKILKRLSKEELKEVGNLVLQNDMKALQAIGKPDSGASVLKMMVAAVAVRVVQKGDMQALDILLNRLIGKVKDEVEHTGPNGAPAMVMLTMPANGSEAK